MVNPPIHIIVERGRVTLEGVVNNNVDRLIANSIASQILSFNVTNELKTDGGSRGRAGEAVGDSIRPTTND